MLPLMDRLGELCKAGADSATYLWQVPGDEGVRRKIAEILAEIKIEAAKGGRREMGRLVEELERHSRCLRARSRWSCCRMALTA
jgi:tRNA(Phe) wybutosine-synthesizing methylase Tyw3